jgi:hypothetical protein
MVREEDMSFESGQLMCCVISSEMISRSHNLIQHFKDLAYVGPSI